MPKGGAILLGVDSMLQYGWGCNLYVIMVGHTFLKNESLDMAMVILEDTMHFKYNDNNPPICFTYNTPDHYSKVLELIQSLLDSGELILSRLEKLEAQKTSNIISNITQPPLNRTVSYSNTTPPPMLLFPKKKHPHTPPEAA
jgi:hypothetical protein